MALRYDETEEFPRELLDRAAQLGLAAFDIPAEYGGGGIESLREICLIVEELTWGDSPIALVINQGGFFAGPVLALGDEEQKRRWLPPLCGPRPPAAAVAITEPGAGSDAAAIATTATRADGGYVLSTRLNVNVPGVAREVAQALVDEAHQICPYSKATRGNIDVTINLV